MSYTTIDAMEAIPLYAGLLKFKFHLLFVTATTHVLLGVSFPQHLADHLTQQGKLDEASK